VSAASRAAGHSPDAPTPIRALSAKTLGVLAVVGLVVAFSLSSTLVKRAESPGVLVAFWRMVTVSLIWNAVLWSTGRRVTLREAGGSRGPAASVIGSAHARVAERSG
jgi:hypothetical protein